MRVRKCAVGLLAACLVTAGIFRIDIGATQSGPEEFDLEEATIPGLLQDQQAGRRTARGIAEQYLSRIQALDRNGPSLTSVIELNPDALAIADALDTERQTKGPRTMAQSLGRDTEPYSSAAPAWPVSPP
jgi:hypothetical protein